MTLFDAMTTAARRGLRVSGWPMGARLRTAAVAFGIIGLVIARVAWAQAAVVDLPTLRQLYAEAALQEDAARRLLTLVRQYQGAEAAVLGYRGVAEAVQARYVWSPLAKLRAVREAQRQFTRAVAADPHNVEVRFLRFTIETNVPPYLGYSQHLAEDRALIMRGAREPGKLGLNAASLRLIRDFMLKHGNCSPEEERMLRRITP